MSKVFKVDRDVFRALVARTDNGKDSINTVVRRLLGLPPRPGARASQVRRRP
jgi:hypothetical protein